MKVEYILKSTFKTFFLFQIFRNHSGAIQSYLEGQLATSKLINSPTEYKHWLLALVSHLMQQGKKLYS